ncbi:MAG: zinc metallopeptidase [Coriobacteriia bacterium]|nr:zinc metallopeptidase [Coriobacteriia bacterium]
MYFYSPTYLFIMIAGLVLGFGTQAWINSAYKKWSRVPLVTGRSGAEVARMMLDENGLQGVAIEQITGKLTDHYDPRARVLRLSEGVYQGRSIASAGVAAHEAGHAVQHARAYAPAALRQALVPAANIGSQLSGVLVLAGFFLNASGLIAIGAWVFFAMVVFQIVTLPVEFDASRRAVAALSNGLPPEQVSGARAVLTAAAMTYVAAALISIMNFLYYLGLSRRN